MFPQRILVALETDQRVEYITASGWDRVYLLWMFRNFRSLPQNVLSPDDPAFGSKPFYAGSTFNRMTLKVATAALALVIAILAWHQLAAQPVTGSSSTQTAAAARRTDEPMVTASQPVTKEPPQKDLAPASVEPAANPVVTAQLTDTGGNPTGTTARVGTAASSSSFSQNFRSRRRSASSADPRPPAEAGLSSLSRDSGSRQSFSSGCGGIRRRSESGQSADRRPCPRCGCGRSCATVALRTLFRCRAASRTRDQYHHLFHLERSRRRQLPQPRRAFPITNAAIQFARTPATHGSSCA